MGMLAIHEAARLGMFRIDLLRIWSSVQLSEVSNHKEKASGCFRI
jgi:hypothetical protein